MSVLWMYPIEKHLVCQMVMFYSMETKLSCWWLLHTAKYIVSVSVWSVNIYCHSDGCVPQVTMVFLSSKPSDGLCLCLGHYSWFDRRGPEVHGTSVHQHQHQPLGDKHQLGKYTEQLSISISLSGMNISSVSIRIDCSLALTSASWGWTWAR